ncbi:MULTISPECIES: UPF0149 family protein [unclassified Oleiphilus]|uniref:UPF0149 family protein n=1 Tax=unclassified Oleiphilus TaxID=2631174 RepID=UPI0007C38752|nr:MULTISPECIES: UPF0149 family protein [unclassified Oleiphilus]KZY65291.1 hypothetical protein A3738_00920 [Oleiphilus sp. HI0066]KZY68489.1 hypothetical protein A3739_01585 [Oleiphilus sp. HI0067]KZZ59906.1 hypothetical protein A3762_16025 [Oleiphilus sp. HI0125]KZZ63080.1 hypothetical protein A3762_12785 [Oleiphilus sp. HI0125]
MSDEMQLESDFEWLANVYNLNGAINHPSELHGIVMGQLAGKSKLQDEIWLGLCLEHMGIEEFNVDKQPNVQSDLCNFYHQTVEKVDADSSEFQICMPDDSYSLSERGESLGAWVSGFLEGIAVAQAQGLTNLDQDLKEILSDLVEISQLDARLDSSETSERDFFEVCEYVRIGVLNLYAEFNEPEPPADTLETNEPSPTLH